MPLPQTIRMIGENNADNAGASDLVVANADGSLVERAEYLQGILLPLSYSVPLCCEKSDGELLTGTDALFNITGGPIKLIEITGIVTTLIVGASNGKLTYTTTTPAATVDMSAAAVAVDDLAAGTSIQHINTTAILTKVTAGIVKEANAFATQPTQFLLPIGQIGFNSSAARVGVIKWYIRYVPLSPNSRVAAAA